MTKEKEIEEATLPLPPQYKKTLELAEGLNSLARFAGFFSYFGVGGEKARSWVGQTKETYRQSNELFSVLQRFNEVFQSSGWIMSESRSIESAKAALTLADAGQYDEAENVLAADYEGEKLDFVCNRFLGVEAFRRREHLIEEARKLCHEKRYIAAIPLMFMIADGVGQDCFGKVIFCEGVDLKELNSIAGQETALPELTMKFGETRQRFNEEQITFPYRHGIIHGRDVNYGNRMIAAKLWAYLTCVADVIRARKDVQAKEPEPEMSLWEALKSLSETRKIREKVEAWKPRPITKPNWLLSSGMPDDLETNTPEFALVELLNAWRSQNYGIMGKRTVYFDNRRIKVRAGEIRERLGEYKLVEAQITKIKDKAFAITEIETLLSIEVGEEIKLRLHTFRLIYGDQQESDAIPRKKQDGFWRVTPSYQGICLLAD